MTGEKPGVAVVAIVLPALAGADEAELGVERLGGDVVGTDLEMAVDAGAVELGERHAEELAGHPLAPPGWRGRHAKELGLAGDLAEEGAADGLPFS